MGIIQRQAVKGSIVSYVGVLLGFITSIYLLPYFFTAEQIGVYRFVFDTGLLLGGVAALGMPNIVLKFFPYLRNKQTHHNGFIIFLYIIPFIGFLLTATLSLIFKDSLINYFSKSTSGYDSYFIYILPLIVVVTLFVSFESFSVVNQRIVVPKAIREIIIRIFVIILLSLYFIKLIDFKTVIKSISAIYFLAFIILLIYIRILDNKIFPLRNFKLIPKNITKKMIAFGSFIILSSLGTSLVNKIDIFVISSELGFTATGIYATSLYIATIIEIPSRSLYQITIPVITESFKNNNIKMIEIIYKKTTQNLIIISGTLFLLLIVNIDNIYSLIPKGDIFSKGKYVIIFIALSKFIDTSVGLNFTILGYSKYYYFSLPLILMLGISNFFLNYLFISFWGLTGSAVATLLILIVNNVIVLSIIYSKYKIHPFSKNNIYPLLIIAASFFIAEYMVCFSNVFLSITFKSLVILLPIGFLTIKYNISEDITKVYNKYIYFIKTVLKKWFYQK